MIQMIIKKLLDQIKLYLFTVLKWTFLPFALMFIVFWLGKFNGVEVSDLTRDTAAVLHGRPYDGLISMIGLFFWSASAAICFLTYSIVKSKESVFKGVFFYGGALSLFLGLDDCFQLHEEVFIHAFPFAEKLFYLVYIGSIVGYFFRFKDQLFETKFLFWIGAMSLFLFSVLLDVVDPFVSHQVYYEDCCKFACIFLWFMFYANSSYSVLTTGKSR
jgi:hypothetical protein